MTTIKLYAEDQHLKIVEKVKLASGDVNTVKLHVDFSSEWDSLIDNSAMFWKNDTQKIDVILLDNECVVPWEVLEKEGTLFISVWACGNVGEGVKFKTSTIVKLNIEAGTPIDDIDHVIEPSEPTPNIFQQYIDAMNSNLDPYLASFKAGVNAHIEDVDAEWTAKMQQRLDSEIQPAVDTKVTEMLGATLLWENPSPTEKFTSLTLQIDTSQFVRFKVVHANNNSDNTGRYKTEEYTEKGVYNQLEFVTVLTSNSSSSSGVYNYTKRLKITDTNITFEKTRQNGTIDATVNGVHSDAFCVPIKIYGYRY